LRDPLSTSHPARAALLACLLCLPGAPGFAQDVPASVSKREMQGLDEQVQEIKSEVLAIAAELARLEEKLLYPSHTQVAVFVALAPGEAFRLDSVELRLDGEPVARHLYRFEELEALRKGGVQRLYTGNVATGEHRLDVTMAGKGPGGDDLSATESVRFSKDAEPELVGLTLSGAPSIRVGGR
jgi:hypothetical protein